MVTSVNWIEIMYYIFFAQFFVLLYNTFIFTSCYQLDHEEEQDFTHFLVKLYNKITSFYQSEEEDDDDDEEESIIEKYEDKYKIKLETLEKTETSIDRLNQLKNSFIIETTPYGNVLMFWDQNRLSFTYYSDKTMPYRFLEVVARKYVIMNRCKDIYYIMENEMKTIQVEPKKKTETSGVFAKLKNYNQSSLHDIKSNVKENRNIKPKPMQQNIPDKKEMVIKEHSNQYSYEGKIMNFSFLKKENKKNNVTFGEFKKKYKNE
jgi:hypothetical protein